MESTKTVSMAANARNNSPMRNRESERCNAVRRNSTINVRSKKRQDL